MVISLKPMIIFIQETMMEGEKSKEVLEAWLKGSSFGYISSDKHSRGLIMAWNQDFEEVQEEKHSTMLKQFLKRKPLGYPMQCIMYMDPIKTGKGFGKLSST